MASKGKNGSFFTRQKPHFLSVILNDVMKHQKIDIPKRFVRNHGSSLSKSGLLKVPNGTIWEVEILKHEGGQVSFRNGWNEFVEYLSIDYGDFVFFEYEGDSLFSVCVIGQSFTEVEYPYNISTDDEEEEEKDQDDDDDDIFVELMDQVSSSSTEKSSPASSCSEPADTANDASCGTQFKSPHRKVTKDKEKLGSSSRDSQGDDGNYSTGHPSELLARKQPLVALEPNNLCFTIEVKDTHLPPKSTMSLPAWFSIKYLIEPKGFVILKVLDGRSWQVRYIICFSGKDKRAILMGFGCFTQDNHLEVDNICFFELLKVEGNKVTFQVSFSRPNPQ